jgi:hypothetical protein
MKCSDRTNSDLLIEVTTWAGLIVFEIRNGVTQIQINCICKILGEILIIRCLIIIEYGMFSTASL